MESIDGIPRTAEAPRTAEDEVLLSRLSDVLHDADALIIVPPFFSELMPCLAVHLLQACARQAGFEVRVLYANVLLAATLGPELYDGVVGRTSNRDLLGERLFAAAAFGASPPAPSSQRPGSASLDGKAPLLDGPSLERLAARVSGWADAVAAAVARRRFKVVGATTSFEQTSASVALLDRVKRLRPDIVTVLGGANCEGEMAQGIASLPTRIDFIFSGESEASWPRFLKDVQSNRLPSTRIVRGRPCGDLDALPLPEYREHREQLETFLPGRCAAERCWIPYESSRGCWWGERSHCTFCGLNGEQMKFREKSADRVLADLRELSGGGQFRKICMVDNIMPHAYFRTLIPRLATELPGLYMFYEQKANLSLAKVRALKAAGVAEIQPGIEALSSTFLARMKKGVTAPQNIALLRYAQSAGVVVRWNLLTDFPGDELPEYEQTLWLLPLLRHLRPPSALGGLRLDRFSPYFMNPGAYGIRDVRPYSGYRELFPERTDCAKLAYYFEGEYESAARANPGVVLQIRQEVEAWRAAWSPGVERPLLWIQRIADDLFLLQDTRGLAGSEEFRFLTREEASLALAGGPARSRAAADFVTGHKLAAVIAGHYVPLAIAEPGLLAELESEAWTGQAAEPPGGAGLSRVQPGGDRGERSGTAEVRRGELAAHARDGRPSSAL